MRSLRNGSRTSAPGSAARLGAIAIALLAALPPARGADATPAIQLRIVGGLAGLNQYTRHEAPFWSERLQQLSAGRYAAEIVPFDRAGIRGQELLAMVRLGTVPFGTLLLSQAAPRDAEMAASDLAGLNPDEASLRRSLGAFRPRLESLLRERHGAELLAVYAYPAQVLFCNRPLSGLAGLKGLTVRTSSATQTDLVESLGAKAVQLPLAEVVANVRAHNVDCAITGTMTGNTIGLHEVTTHVHRMAINWGLSVFIANGAAWRALPEDLRALLRQELPRLEAEIWDESMRETAEGVACNTGSKDCRSGRAGKLTAIPQSAADEELRRSIFARTVLPNWLKRCGASCRDSWNRYMAGVTGIEAKAGP